MTRPSPSPVTDDGVVERIAALLADYRHNRLGVTYGRKKCSVMAIDQMTADKIAALIPLAGEL